MTAIRRAGILLRGLSAAAILVALVAGVPALLVGTVGNPIPDQSTWTSPLTTGALLGVLACVAWVFWAQLVICVIIELIAEVRLATGRSADWLSRVPGTFGGQQAFARTLVQAVVAVGITTAAATSSPGSLDRPRRRCSSSIECRPGSRADPHCGAGSGRTECGVEAAEGADHQRHGRPRRHPVVDRRAAPGGRRTVARNRRTQPGSRDE